MTNANWVFDKAIHLMDEQNESNGNTQTQDTKEYRLRTLSILNVLRHELYGYSDTYEARTDGRRSILPLITDFEQDLGLDDTIAQGVMPYGLAAHLLLGEDDAKAAFFNQRYQELIVTIAARKPAVFEDIVSEYGGVDW